MQQHDLGNALHATGKAVIYLRVSTEEQVDNYSLETQEDICRKEAQRKGLEVIEAFREEGRSAKNISGRPALIQMLEYCRKHKREVDAVIIYRLDRISRQTSDYLAIRKKLAECEIKLISATEPTGNSPTEKFVETMLAGFAQMDNDVRGERSRNGLRARFQCGLPGGYVPIGYLIQSGYAVKDPASFDVIKESWDMMAAGTHTLHGIADFLNEKGVMSGKGAKKGFKVRPQTANRIYRNKFYAGKMISVKYSQEVQGQHVPMVTEEVFYKVQAILDGRNTNIKTPIVKRSKDNPDFPLRRIVKCGICGTSLTGGWSKGKLGVRYAYYFCRNGCKLPKSAISVDVLEKATLELLESLAPSDNTINMFNALLRQTYRQRLSGLQMRREQADAELKKLYEFRQTLLEKNMGGVYSDDIFKEQNKIVEEKIN